jgi:hypothetical protein
MNESLSTNGVGYWTDEQRAVACTGLVVAYVAELEDGETEPSFGELRVYFAMDSWDVDQHGLIYTDKGFMDELRDYLTRAGYDASDVAYSEQGMQGFNYVSLDVGANFLRSWNKQ